MYPTGLLMIAAGLAITLAVVPRSRVLPPDHLDLMVEP
jgi:hypothetical protein